MASIRIGMIDRSVKHFHGLDNAEAMEIQHRLGSESGVLNLEFHSDRGLVKLHIDADQVLSVDVKMSL